MNSSLTKEGRQFLRNTYLSNNIEQERPKEPSTDFDIATSSPVEESLWYLWQIVLPEVVASSCCSGVGGGSSPLMTALAKGVFRCFSACSRKRVSTDSPSRSVSREESRKPLANGFESIFNLVICKSHSIQRHTIYDYTRMYLKFRMEHYEKILRNTTSL